MMTRGIITSVVPGELRTHNADNQPYKNAGRSITIGVDGQLYTLGWLCEAWTFMPKVGDEVEFQFDPKTRKIIDNADNRSYKNITNPGGPNSRKAGGGGNKAFDPHRTAREVLASNVESAVTMLSHNLPGQQIKLEHVKQLATALTDFVLNEYKVPATAPVQQPAQAAPVIQVSQNGNGSAAPYYAAEHSMYGNNGHNQVPPDDDIPF